MKLAEKHAVRFAKVMTCLNIGCPLGMGIWEGVPLRDVWMTQPREDMRRVFYYGYHNDDPEQMFRSSLPIGRVFEDSVRSTAGHRLLQAQRAMAASERAGRCGSSCPRRMACPSRSNGCRTSC